MDLRSLEAFYWAAHLGSVTKAAHRLNTSQPAVSARLQRLEAELGRTLFEGNTRSRRLTVTGRRLLERVERLLELVSGIRGELADEHLLAGVLRIGAADIVAMTWLPALMDRLKADYPQLTVQLETGLSVELRARLLRGELDVAFVVGPVTGTGIRTEPLAEVPTHWMASPRLLQSHPVRTVADLARVPILSHSPGSDLHDRMLDWFTERGSAPPRFHTCGSLPMLIMLTTQGIGASVLPPAVVTALGYGDALVRLPEDFSFEANRFLVAYRDDAFAVVARMAARLAHEVVDRSG